MSEPIKVPKGRSQEDVDEALRQLDRIKAQRERQKAKQSSPEHKAKQAANNKRRRIKDKLLMDKAAAKGITVTEEEVDKVIAAESATTPLV